MSKNKKIILLLLLMSFASVISNNAFAQTSKHQDSPKIQQSPVTNILDTSDKSKQEAVKASISGSVEKKEQARQITQKKEVNLLMSPTNSLGLTYAEISINKSLNFLNHKQISEAKNTLEPVYNWLNESTENHTNLYKVLKDIDTAKSQADVERELALKFAVLRDKASYQLALIYIEEKRPQKAVENLVNIVRSQPRTQLGFASYNVLQQIGFTYKLQLKSAPSEDGKTESSTSE